MYRPVHPKKHYLLSLTLQHECMNGSSNRGHIGYEMFINKFFRTHARWLCLDLSSIEPTCALFMIAENLFDSVLRYNCTRDNNDSTGICVEGQKRLLAICHNSEKKCQEISLAQPHL